jgi:hypothetical protein
VIFRYGRLVGCEVSQLVTDRSLIPLQILGSEDFHLMSISSQPSDQQIWDSLKQAIADSSGFHQWQRDRQVTTIVDGDEALDQQVYRYLRETLETLAY